MSPAVLAGVLSIPEATIRKVRSRHADEMESECVTDRHALEFLKKHKVEFGFGRSIRKGIILISQMDMLIIAQLSKSQTSKEFRKKFAQFMIENGRRDYVHKDRYEQALLDRDNIAMELGRLTCEVEALKRIIMPGKEIKLKVVN